MSYQDIEIEKVLDIIKDRVRFNQMNLLVGSGVSCCACNLYENWVGLVKDMVAFLYQDELACKGIEVKKIEEYYCHYNLIRKESPADTDYVYDIITVR